MELHMIFTHMLKKGLISIEEMVVIAVIGQEIQKQLACRIGNGIPLNPLFDENGDMTVTLDSRSLLRKNKRLANRMATDIIQPLMDKRLPLVTDGPAKDVLVKEMRRRHPSELLELVINNAFLPLLGGMRYGALLVEKGYCKPTGEKNG